MAITRNNTNQRTNKEETVELIIQEQKRDYDYLLHIYNRMRATEGLLLTAVFGVVAYLYSSGFQGNKASLTERLSMPAEDYGKVIYLMAIGFFAYGVVKLMINVFGNNPWMTAYEKEKTDYKYNSKHLDTLDYIKSRYDICLEFNGEKYNKRKNELGFLFYCTLISATILIVIKTLT